MLVMLNIVLFIFKDFDYSVRFRFSPKIYSQ